MRKGFGESRPLVVYLTNRRQKTDGNLPGQTNALDDGAQWCGPEQRGSVLAGDQANGFELSDPHARRGQRLSALPFRKVGRRKGALSGAAKPLRGSAASPFPSALARTEAAAATAVSTLPKPRGPELVATYVANFAGK